MYVHFYKGFAIEDDGIFSDDYPYSVFYDGDEVLFETIEDAMKFIDEITELDPNWENKLNLDDYDLENGCPIATGYGAWATLTNND